MTYVVTFTGYTPGKRYTSPATSWTQVRIDQAATFAGPFTTVETQALSPLDTDPTKPQVRNVTTSLGTISPGYYRLVWLDAAAGEEDTTPVAYPANSSSIDLTTLAQVRAEQQKPSANTDQDAIISALITQASAAIIRWTEREFAPITMGLTRTFEWPWESALVSFAPFDLATLTSVHVDTDIVVGGSLIPATDYRPWPANAKDGVYTGLRLRPLVFNTGRVMFPERQVQVTGDWGFPTIPDAVRRACIITVNEWLRDRWMRDPGMTVELAAAGMPEAGRPSALPFAARALLEPLRRPSFG